MAMGVSVCVRACVFLSVSVCVCAAFNLDTSFPILKSNGEKGSLFGLSVALHQDMDTHSYRLLVGAPQEKAELNIPANRTGGMFSCPITAQHSDCGRVALIDPARVSQDRQFEDMWLGVTVASQGQPGGRVLVCGHRFVKLYGAYRLRHMIGRCYVLGNNLLYNKTDSYRWQNPDQTCNDQEDETKDGMCTAGISASITQTGIVLGTPGSYYWQGNVHVSLMNPDDEYGTKKYSFPDLEERNIYKGYSVTQAYGLLSQDVETIVTGAPRHSKTDAYGSVFLAEQTGHDQLISRLTLHGEQTGSYFGNAVATTDINNDGWNDLLVGAPFFFQQGQEMGGACYLFLNQAGVFERSVRLTGPAGSGLGMSVAAAGDLDQDGFQDFAVGAPFHGTGSVFIWNGNKHGVSQEPSQVIEGSRVSAAFRTFGFSLSGGLDVDGNKYPDLLVGSLDDTVALLRTRPVVHLDKTISVSPEIIDPNNCDFCIKVTVCFSYTFSTGGQSHSDNITVHYTIAADVTSLMPRLCFRGNRQTKSQFSGFLSLLKDGCEVLRVGLMSPIRDYIKPMVFSLSVSLHEESPKKKNSVVQDLRRLPVLRATDRAIRTQIHFQKACGSDNSCHSNLQMEAQFTDEDQEPFPRQEDSQLLTYDGSIRKVSLEVNISNNAEDAHNAFLHINTSTHLVYSGVHTKGEGQPVECSNENSVLVCELGNPFRSNQKIQVLIKFQLTELSFDTKEIEAVLQLSTLSEQSDLSPVSLSMLVDYSLKTYLSLMEQISPASFSGHVIGESAMEKTEDIGSLLLFTLQVGLVGKPLGRHGTLEVQFDWPMKVSNGKWLLYVEDIEMNGTAESVCDPPGDIVNPLHLQLSKTQRKRRSLEEKTASVLHLQSQKKNNYILDCVNGAVCVQFVCPLNNMKNWATLTVKARLWSSTFIEDYSDAWSVLVRARASLKLQTDKPTINMPSHTTPIEVLLSNEMAQEDGGAPLWIVCVSALMGVLLLALLCVLLWKCGFFQRASTRELYEAKVEKALKKSQPSKSKRLEEELEPGQRGCCQVLCASDAAPGKDSG